MTQRFQDLTTREMAALEEGEVQRWIEKECAFMGAPMLPPTPEEPIEPEGLTPDLRLWEVGGYLFSEEDDARAVADFIESRPSLGRMAGHSWSDKYYFEQVKPETVDVSPDKQSSANHYNKISGVKKAFEQAKSRYRDQAELVEEAVEKRSDITSRVWSAYHRAVDSINGEQLFRDRYAEYLNLADNNPAMAYSFLVKAYPDFVEQYPEFDEEINPQALEAPDERL